MEKSQTLSQNIFDFKNFVPVELYKKYFDVILSDENVYICIVQNEDQIGAIYLERPKDKTDKVDGVVRMFFQLDDLRKYGKSVASSEEIPYESVRRWEMNFNKLIDHISKMDSKYKAMGKKGVRLVASAVHEEKFLDIDIVWTSESNLMV
jgi:hypothetical protein